MEDNESSWINIADVMSALMMIFMFISIAFMYQLQNEKEIYKVDLNEALHKEFEKDLKTWEAEITEDNIIRFNAPFKMGGYEIPLVFNTILSEFFPRYIKVLTMNEFKNEIDEIRVEGHTSYGWGGKASRKDIYLNNMNLSQQRASKVLNYCYSLENKMIADNIQWIQTNLRANGMAFSNLLYKDKDKKIQDYEKSRRVEFKVVTKDHF
jgi:chemotaxis protein MotB